MQRPVVIKQNDTLPPLVATLTGADGVPQQLPAGTLVRFSMRPVGGAAAISRQDCQVINIAGGVQYDWATGDTAVPGQFEGEFEVTFTDASVLTFPNDGYFPIVIAAQIG